MTHRTHPVDVAFFKRSAGFYYDPARETEAQGRLRCARELAAAEAEARSAGCSFAWEIDEMGSSADWIARGEDGGPDRDPWAVWQCTMYDAEGQAVDGVGGVDFGREGSPHGDPYRRVVEAELALSWLATNPQEG